MSSYTFTTINDPLGGTGFTGDIFYGFPEKGTEVEGISANTSNVVGQYESSDNTPHGFLYNGTTYTTINDPLGTFSSAALGINDTGQIVGAYTDMTGFHGFLDSGGTFTTLNGPSGSTNTLAIGINDASQIIGVYTDAGGAVHGFLYNGTTYTTLNDPLGTGGTAALGINSTGEIVGAYADSGGKGHGFLFSGGNYITLDDPLGVNGTAAIGINDVGEIVGSYLDSNHIAHGFLFYDGTYTTIDNPLGTGGSAAIGVNNMGQIAGDYTTGGTSFGFLASPPPTSATSVQQEVLGLYAALYNRAADSLGFPFWVNVDGQQADSGGVTVGNAATTAVTLNDAAVLGQDFVNTQSTYFNQTYASLTDNQFINALYVNLGGNAGDPGGITYWANLLAQAEAGGQSVQAARAGLVGQFVHDLIDFNLAPGAAALGLTTAQYEAAEQRQASINGKIGVSLAYLTASEQPNGAILNASAVGDSAFQASVTVIQPVNFDPVTVITAITGINNAVTHQDLSLI